MQDLFGEEVPSSDAHYDHEAGKRYCDMLGLGWDADFARRIDLLASSEGLTQAQFDILVREYAWKVSWLFFPRAYSWPARIKLAAHFLNPFVRDMFVQKKEV